MPTMVEVPALPDPGLPGAGSSTSDSGTDNTESGGQKEPTVTPKRDVFVQYGFSIAVPKPRTINQHMAGKQPHQYVAEAINLIAEHFPNVKLYSALSKKLLLFGESGLFECEDADDLKAIADMVTHSSAPSRAGFKFLMKSPWGDMEALKDQKEDF